MRTRSLLMTIVVLSVACGGRMEVDAAAGPARATDAGVSPSLPTPTIPPVAVEVRCTTDGAPAFRRVATDPVALRRGPCGTLAWHAAKGGAFVLDANAREPERLREGASMPTPSLSGRTVAFHDSKARAVVVRDRATGAESTVATVAPDARPSFAFVARSRKVAGPGDETLVVCLGADPAVAWSEGRTVPVLGADALPLTCSDLLAPPEGGTSVAAVDAAGTITVFDGTTGRANRVPGVSYLRTSGLSETMGLWFTDDGSLLVRGRQKVEPCGDTSCGKDASLTMIDAKLGTVVRDVPIRAQECCGGSNFLAQVIPSGPFPIAVGLSTSLEWVDSSMRSGSRARKGAVAILADGQRGLFVDDVSERAVVIRRLEDDAELGRVAKGSEVVLSKGLRYAYVSTDPSRCITNESDPRNCFAQLYGLARWDLTTLAVTPIAESLQPLRAKWVGDDGSAVVLAGLREGGYPSASTPEKLGVDTYHSWLFDASGGRHETVASEVGVTYWTTDRGPVLTSFATGHGFGVAAIDPRTGVVKDLTASADRPLDRIQSFAIGTGTHYGVLEARATLPDGGAIGELWAGDVAP
ncbi:MAG: hypothetical protein U0169_16420 [Polyangiaceae bacterium]